MYEQPWNSGYMHTVLGVPGRMTHRTISFTNKRHETHPDVFFKQRWVSETRRTKEPVPGHMKVTVRFDDECGNGHNTFSVTADVKYSNGASSGGCMHDDIAQTFPELAPLLRWHLVSTDGPMHYIANVLYFASDRDHNGLRKGESRQIRNGKTGALCWRFALVGPAGEVKPEKYAEGERPPVVDAIGMYVPWTREGEGKERQFDAARSTAVWPEATDEVLSLEPAELRPILEARLPALLAAFRADIEAAGFRWSARK